MSSNLLKQDSEHDFSSYIRDLTKDEKTEWLRLAYSGDPFSLRDYSDKLVNEGVNVGQIMRVFRENIKELKEKGSIKSVVMAHKGQPYRLDGLVKCIGF